MGHKTCSDTGQSSLRLVKDGNSCSPPVSKLLIMSDSHGRGLGSYINFKIDNTKLDVLSVCRPGAKLADVLSGIESFSDKFTRNDYIVII